MFIDPVVNPSLVGGRTAAELHGSGALIIKGTLDLGVNPLTLISSFTAPSIETVAGSTIKSSIASLTSFGKISGAGNITVNGGLSVDLLGGYLPVAGDTFNVVTTSGSATGIFSPANIPANATISYTGSNSAPPNVAVLTFASNTTTTTTTTTSNSNDSSSTDTDEADSVIAALTNENSTFSSEDNIQNNLDEINQTKQDEDEIKAPEKVLVALNFIDDPKANKDNPIETEKPKGRTLQCSVSK
jgi:hypothetical protein